MLESIIDNIDDKIIKQKLKTSLENNNNNLLKFIQSSPYADSILVKNIKLLEIFFNLEEFYQNNEKKVLPNELSIQNYLNELKIKYSDKLKKENYEYLFESLRELKSTEMVRIGIYDYFKINPVEKTLLYISNLADFCIEIAIRASSLKLNNLLNIKQIIENIIIIGMGKLGGNELNFSSDIDLIFIGNDDFIQNEQNIKNLQIFFKQFLDFLRNNSPFGFLYRVDLRLRPEGNSGPIIMGLKNAINYYVERGRNWEYQAMIKNRFIWGNINIYKELIKNLEPLIYSHIQPEKIVEEIKDIKDQIEKKIIIKNIKKTNIKLSPGGIRDIEFIIQFLQLVHGVRYLEIRKNNSLEALEALRTFNIITIEEYDILKNNYLFFRKIENILQFNNNIANHDIPENNDDIERIFSCWNILESDNSNFIKIFKKNIISKMNEVRKIFTQLFDETIRYINLKNNILDNYSDISKDLIEHHFLRMDSEYFLRFQETDIYDHLSMIKKLNKENLVEISIKQINQFEWNVTIVAFDYTYEFSKISGLLSANYLEILDGESFTYCDYNENDNNQDKKQFFYRRIKKNIYLNNQMINDKKSLLQKRKIVCFTRVKAIYKDKIPDWINLKNDLNSLLKLLDENKQKEASEILNLKIIDVLKNVQKSDVSTITPIEIMIDNQSSNQYTILHIKSNNSFAFLYTFTNVLAMRNYYIYKVEINTINENAMDRLFIMTRDGNKIISETKIKELEITITMIKMYSSLLFNALDPNKALNYFDELLTRIFESESKKELPILGQKDVLEKLATIFGISDFIWEDLFRFNYHTMLPLLNDQIINQSYTKETLFDIFKSDYCNNLDYLDIDINEFTKIINNFKDRESFRIDLRQILKKIDFWHFAVELTTLADLILELSLKRIEKELLKSYDFSLIPPWTIFGLGKLGGKELGYASDIELIFIYDIPFELKDNFYIHNYFEKFIQQFLKIIKTKREGIFEIDLNLRPHGKKGNLAVSLDSFKKYFSKDGEAYFFERQALIKLRYIISNNTGRYLENEIIKSKDDFVYSNVPVDFDSLYKTRKMQLENYIKDKLNIKYSSGGLVDIEYIVQILQIYYGNKYPECRDYSTLDGLDALFNQKLINNEYYTNLKKIYTFYRNLINTLRMVKGNSKDLTINFNNQLEFDFLLKRSYFVGIIEENSKEILLDKINNYMNIIKKYFEELKYLPPIK